MTTEAPVIKEIYIPDIPDEFAKPEETSIEQPGEQPVTAPAKTAGG
jgi:hypothetical protein